MNTLNPWKKYHFYMKKNLFMYVKCVGVAARCVVKAVSARLLELYVTVTIPTVEKDWIGYPVVIMQARYSGAYEGNKWICIPHFSCDNHMIVEYMNGDDDDALEYIASAEWSKVGVGRSPNSAHVDMVKKLT